MILFSVTSGEGGERINVSWFVHSAVLMSCHFVLTWTGSWSRAWSSRLSLSWRSDTDCTRSSTAAAAVESKWLRLLKFSAWTCIKTHSLHTWARRKNIFYDFMDGFINWLLPELLISRLMPLPRVLACCLPAPAAFSPDISHINIRSYTQMFCLSSFQGKSKTWIFYWTLK